MRKKIISIVFQAIDTINKHAQLPIQDDYDYQIYGIRVFYFENGLIDSLKSLVDTLTLFINVLIDEPNVNPIIAQLNVNFLADKVHYYLDNFTKKEQMLFIVKLYNFNLAEVKNSGF